MKEKWSIEQANEWYQKQGWLRGCNFIGSDWVNRLDGFQNYKHEEKLKTAEREIALEKEEIMILQNGNMIYLGLI